MPNLLSKFQKNPSITFWVMLLTHRQTDRQTNKQTKTGKNITSLAEVTSSPGNGSFWKQTSVLPQIIYLFCSMQHLRAPWPIIAKFCTMISTRPNCIIPVQNVIKRPCQKKFQGLAIPNLARISLKWIKIFRIKQIFDLPQFFPVFSKK